MNPTMKKDKIELIICLALAALLILIGYLTFGKHYRQVNDAIENDGIYTIGTVTHLSKIKGKNNYTTIRFEFEHDGRIIKGSARNGKYFNEAIVGKQYAVRYVPDMITQKSFTDYAKIYINVPIPQEFIIEQIIQYLSERDSTIKDN